MVRFICIILSLFGLKEMSRFFQQMTTWEFEAEICDIIALLNREQIGKLNNGEEIIVSLQNKRMINLLENLEDRPFVELALKIVGHSFGLKLNHFKASIPFTQMSEAEHFLRIVTEQEADELDLEEKVVITRNRFETNPPRQLEELKPKAMAAKA